MATALEQAFINSVRIAQGTRQTALASAFATYAPNGFGVVANFAAYNTALVAADVAFWAAVNTAATTAGITPSVVPDTQGQIYGNWATIIT